MSGTNYQLTGLQNNTNYEWQLRATCNGPNDFTPISFFGTTCKTTASFGYITAAATQISADFYNNNNTATELRYRPQGEVWQTMAVNTSPALLDELTTNTLYELQVRSGCDGGTWSAWDQPRFATTACPKARSLNASQLTDNSVLLGWQYERRFISSTIRPSLRYRPLGETTWQTVVITIPPVDDQFSYSLTGLLSQTTYEWQVIYSCGGVLSGTSAFPVTFRTTGAAQPCTTLKTVQNGNWSDAATWSCGRVPLTTDAVWVGHTVHLPADVAPTAKQITFGADGILRYGNAVQLVIGR